MDSHATASIDVAYVAELARIELIEEEKVTFQRQLTEILRYVHQLAEVDLASLPLSAPPILNHLREDSPRESLPRNIVLDNAPERSAELILMPKVVE
jgi:aspartyl-tRNA(Asn)/glutamyl-tRNA(Gln) amidotransferase subunit C